MAEKRKKAIEKIGVEDEYKKKIVETLEKIEGIERLVKIHTVIKTHLKLQNGEI